MAQIEIVKFYSASTGGPLSGLTPTFNLYADDTGSALTAPTVTDLGGGEYKFTHSLPTDKNVVWILDGGASALPRYQSRAARVEDYGTTGTSSPLEIFFLFSASTGAPLTGATPTFTQYIGVTGSAVTQPSISAIGGGAYKFLPDFSSNTDGVTYILDAGTSASSRYHGRFMTASDWDAGSSTIYVGVPYLLVEPGVLTNTASGGSGTTAADQAAARGLATPAFRDFARDLTTGELVISKGDLAGVYESDAIVQDIKQYMQLFKGEWYLDQTAGVPYWEKVFVANPDLGALNAMFKSELEKVAGVRSVKSLSLNFKKATRELVVNFTVDTDNGELKAAPIVTVGA